MNTFAYLCGMKKELKEFFANKEAIGEMIRFAIVGTLVTAIHYGVYWLLQLVMNVNIAWTAGYIAGFIFNYYMSAYYIFYLLQMVLLNFFIWIGMSAELAPVGVYAVSIPVNFLLVRFVFKKM